jgi:hypothetical protein
MGAGRPFYAFRLDEIDVENPRGKIPDNDIVTFSIFVNQEERGRGAGMFPDLAAGAKVTAAGLVEPTTRDGISWHWIIGPMEIALGDGISVVYSGMNTSDDELDLSQQSQIEVKILDAIVSGVVGAASLGDIAAVVTGVLGVIGDPVGKFLGFQKQGPCNGLVFSDTVAFTGAGLSDLQYGPPEFASMPDATEVSFTRTYTDEATHNSDVCGQIAHTIIKFSVLRLPYVSIRDYANEFGLASSQLLSKPPQAGSASLRSRLRLR